MEVAAAVELVAAAVEVAAAEVSNLNILQLSQFREC